MSSIVGPGILDLPLKDRTCTTSSPCVDLGVRSWNSHNTQYFVPDPTDSSRASAVCDCVVAVAVSDIASECPAVSSPTLASVPGGGVASSACACRASIARANPPWGVLWGAVPSSRCSRWRSPHELASHLATCRLKVAVVSFLRSAAGHLGKIPMVVFRPVGRCVFRQVHQTWQCLPPYV